MIVSLFAGTALSVSAKTEGPISSETVYTYQPGAPTELFVEGRYSTF